MLRSFILGTELSTGKVFKQLNSRSFHHTVGLKEPCRQFSIYEELEMERKFKEECNKTSEKAKQLEKDLCEARTILAKIDVNSEALKDPMIRQRLEQQVREHRKHREEDHETTVKAVKVKIAAVENELDNIAAGRSYGYSKIDLIGSLSSLQRTLAKLENADYLASPAFLDRHSAIEEETCKVVNEASNWLRKSF